MTIFAGIFCLFDNDSIPESLCDEVNHSLSRDSRDEIVSHRSPKYYVAKIDIGAYGGRAFLVDEGGSVSVLAGDPLLKQTGRDSSREEQLRYLHDDWLRDDWESLAQVRGVFCAVHYQPTTNRLSLIADKLCLRPIYYWKGERHIVFATALRILESLISLPKTIDLRGVTEAASLGYPLGRRTPYSEISMLGAAEVIHFSRSDTTSHQYWRWDRIESAKSSSTEQLTTAYQLFMDSVSYRLGKEKTTIAFLSGGLDSRVIVAALRLLNARVHTFNFSLPGTLNQFLGAEVARRLDCLHTEIPIKPGSPDYTKLMAKGWAHSSFRAQWPPERQSMVWSGDGGSVGLGHVYLTHEIVNLMRRGNVDSAVDNFLKQEKAFVLHRLLRSEISEQMSGTIHKGIKEELDDIHCDDPGRSFYVFMLLNDQRRHLARHFENIDEHRLEMHLPLLDSDFLAHITSCPIDFCLEHRFYNEWIKLFDSPVAAMPWQAYPGHEPGPMPLPQGFDYQWDSAHLSDQRKSRKKESLAQAAQMLSARDFPAAILRSSYLRLATILYRLGLRDYDYLIEAAGTYHRHWAVCEKSLNLGESQLMH
jgi:asparagine synthase (glutamine-hydrolysing)